MGATEKPKKKIGLAVTGGDAPSASLCRKIAEHADIIAAADSGLLRAEDAGLTPDFIIGDMDSLGDESRLLKYDEKIIRRYPRDKDYTDTELVFEALCDKQCDEVWLAGGGGGRLDHLFGIRTMFERERCPSRWYTADASVFIIEGGTTNCRLARSLPCGSIVSVFTLGGGDWKAASGGLKWELDSVRWSRGFFGLSNVTCEDSFFITAESGRFMIVIPESGVL
jgi:thiamine pyrophosphokinase